MKKPYCHYGVYLWNSMYKSFLCLWCDTRGKYNTWFKLNIWLNVWKSHFWNILKHLSQFLIQIFILLKQWKREIYIVQVMEIMESGRLHQHFLCQHNLLLLSWQIDSSRSSVIEFQKYFHWEWSQQETEFTQWFIQRYFNKGTTHWWMWLTNLGYIQPLANKLDLVKMIHFFHFRSQSFGIYYNLNLEQLFQMSSPESPVKH